MNAWSHWSAVSCIQLFSSCSLMSRLHMRFTASFFIAALFLIVDAPPPLPCHVPNLIAVYTDFIFVIQTSSILKENHLNFM